MQNNKLDFSQGHQSDLKAGSLPHKAMVTVVTSVA